MEYFAAIRMRTLNVLLWKDHHDTSVKQKKKMYAEWCVYHLTFMFKKGGICLKKL